MKSAPSIVIALFFVATANGHAEAASLRTSVTVESDVVRLGDLFNGVDANPDVIVAEAPDPGARLMLGAHRLQEIARRSGIKWRPESRYQRSVVRRTGRRIAKKEIETALLASLRGEGLEPDWNVKLSKSDLTVHVAIDEERQVRVLTPHFSTENKRFSAVLQVPRGKRGDQRRHITGQIYRMVRIPVLARQVQRGEVIRESDLDFVEREEESVPRTALLDKERIVGMALRRLSRPGAAIRVGDLRPPIMVEKGSLVTLVFRTDRMFITARGKALDTGADGETVRVQNSRSRSTVQGIVRGRNRVEIAFDGVGR